MILRRLVIVSITVLVATANPLYAGDCPVDISELGNWEQGGSSYGDVWGDGNIAYMGQYGGNGVHFIDITNPNNPTQILEWTVQSPNTFASAQDVKVHDGLLFIALESDNNDGVEIVDVSDPLNPAHLTWVDTPTMSRVHNVFYDSGYLYIVNSATPDIAIVDLTNYNRENPPANITQNKWLISAGSDFVHDITVKDGIMYACAWDSGLYVYDVTNIANQPPVFLGSGAGNNTHAVWPSDDGRWAVVGEERGGGPVHLYEIIPNGGSVDVVLRDTVVKSENETVSAHNPVVIGTRVYVSWYQAGLVILDIDEDNAELIERGSYDTYGGGVFGFNGAWGVYPFLGEDRILVSDITNGLFVVSSSTLVDIGYPDGLVTEVHPADGATLQVQISGECGDPDPSTATVHVNINDQEGGTIDVPLTPIGGDLYEADLPGAPCGSAYSYYMSVETFEGDTVFDPPGAPGASYSANVLTSLEVLFADNFEDDNGWTASSEQCPGENQTGFWERVDPNGTGRAPEDDYPGGEGTLCYVTDQGPVGGGDGEADVDGGPFILTSPTIATDGQDAFVSYARWYSSNSDDPMLVEISGDGGDNWMPVESVSDTGEVWVLHEFKISDVMAPAESVTLRFTVVDCPNGSLVEGGVDEFGVVVIECEDSDVTPPAIVHDGGTSTNPFSGYVDPRRESDNGADLNQGIESVSIAFTEEVFNVGGADLDATAFSVTSTGAPAPNVDSIDATGNPVVVVNFDGNLTPGSWYTVIASVQDAAGNVIESAGNQGPGVDETDRVDVGFLPADIDQTGEVTPFDLLQFRQIVQGSFDPPAGTDGDFVDTDRNGTVEPFDLLAYRLLINGTTPATQSWSAATLDADQP